jgi:glycosyltransferase involved in cell wall biosynthesis
MKVLHVVTAFPRQEGDVITPWLVETLKRLRMRGIDARVMTSSYKGLRNQIVEGIPVQRFRYFFKPWENLTHEETAPDRIKKGLVYKLLPFFYVLFGSAAVIQAVRREPFDIVHIHWPFPHALFGYLAKKAGGTKIVTTFYGVELRWVKTQMPFLRSFLRWGIILSDRVTAISMYTAREVRDLVPEEEVAVEVIPYTITVSPSNNSVPSFECRDPMILFAGRLVERKGVEYLIRAFKEIVREIPSDLFIVGEGPEQEKLERIAKELGLTGKVQFKGKVSQTDLESLYSQCNVFVLPAIIDSKGDTEGLGVVLLEAMSYKKPVVASNLGGITDIVKDGDTGLLVPEKDPHNLAEAIKSILREPSLASNLGKRGYDHVQKHFSWERIISCWTALYGGVARVPKQKGKTITSATWKARNTALPDLIKPFWLLKSWIQNFEAGNKL